MPRKVKRSSTYRPSSSRITDIRGFATSVERFESTVAPAKAPIAPGMPMRRTTFQSTLPKRQCEAPETALVPISARWIVALIAAGESVVSATRKVVAVTPKAMPRLPSTSCPSSPTKATMTRVGMLVSCG